MNADIKVFNFAKNRTIGFEIKDLNELRNLEYIFSKAHKATFYQLIWIIEGQAIFYIDFQKIIIPAGNLLVVTTNQIIKFDIESDYKGKLILFTDTFFNQTKLDTVFLQTAEIFNPSLLNQLVEWNIHELNELLYSIDNELQNYDSTLFQQQIVQGYLRIILLNTERQANQKTPQNPNKEIIRKFFDQVEKYFTTHRDVEFYLNQLNIGDKKLSKEIKSQLSIKPKQYIDNRIILEAKRLLIYNRDLNIKEIAFNLGFDEPTNFTKFFKKKEGLSPNAFKENELNKFI